LSYSCYFASIYSSKTHSVVITVVGGAVVLFEAIGVIMLRELPAAELLRCGYHGALMWPHAVSTGAA